MFLVPIDVECYAGRKADQAPRSFQWLGRRIEVIRIVDRWYEGNVDPARPCACYFKVQGADHKTHLLKQMEAEETWYLCVRI